MSPGAQSVLEPAATAAGAIHDLWSLMLWTCTVIFIAVLVVLALALVRRRHDESRQSPVSRDSSAAATRSVAVATALTVLILFGFLIASISTSRAIAEVRPTSAVSIQITGHQWW